MITEKDMITLTCTEAQFYRAEYRAKKLGKLNNSITNGEGNLAAFIGEEVVKDYLGAKYATNDFYNHDLFLEDKKIEVKTKRRKVSPKLHYEVSVAKTSSHQKPDYYVFTSLFNRSLTIVGYISHKDFHKKSKLIPMGSIDKSNGFLCHTDMYNLTHSELNPISELKHVLSS